MKILLKKKGKALTAVSISIFNAQMNIVKVSRQGFRKAMEESGASHSMDVVGWAFIAVAVVLGVYAFLPAQVKTFVTNAFTEMNAGLV